MGNPVVHFEVIGKDPQALQAFYQQAFDWQIEPSSGAGGVDYRLIHPKVPGGIDGGIGGPVNGYAGHVTFYVGVPDVEASLVAIERLGGRRMMGPDAVPGGPTIGLFTDPEDHVIGLVQIDNAK